MHISLITPHPQQPIRGGNRTTAERWARLLRALGHRVNVSLRWDERPADCMIAIHAWRSRESIERFESVHPEHPLIVALAGTDVYEFQHSDPAATLAAMRRADRLVALHDAVGNDIPAEFGHKLHTIIQSAVPAPGPRVPARRHFDICFVANCRAVKDPLRAAIAARDLPASSRARILHLGGAEEPEWQARVDAEVARNPRYRWLGAVAHWQVRRRLRRARCMVISSLAEGGANVVSEAMVAECPVLASRISGNVGLLGNSHPAYFEPGDTGALTRLILRAETDPSFLGAVSAHQAGRRHRFTPESERDGWQAVLASLA